MLPAPFHSDFAAPFAIVAAWIGLLSGLAAQWGFFRSRPNADWGKIAGAACSSSSSSAASATTGSCRSTPTGRSRSSATPRAPRRSSSLLGYLIAIGIIAAIVGLIVLLVVRRDIGVAYVAIAGLICGIVSAIISAPIAAVVFGGVTGSGTDLLVAAFQQAGADLQTAVLQQGLISDPIDKTLDVLHRLRPAPDAVATVRRAVPAG